MQQKAQRQQRPHDPPLAPRPGLSGDQAAHQSAGISSRRLSQRGANQPPVENRAHAGSSGARSADAGRTGAGHPAQGRGRAIDLAREVLQILEARLVNEPYCIGLAVERATNQEIARMQELLASAGALIRARDREKLMNLDREFHRLISDAAHNSIIADILTMLHERSLRFWFIAFGDDLQLRRIDEEHRAILWAIKQPRSRRSRSGDARAYQIVAQSHHARDLTGVFRHAAYGKRAP